MHFILFVVLLFSISLFLFLYSYFWIDIGIIYMISQERSFFNLLFDYRVFGGDRRLEFFIGFLLAITLLFALQILFLYGYLNKIKPKKLLIIFAITSFLFAISYNFISHDLFNYLFSAKIIWVYHNNPFLVAPSMYNNDLWVSFMHTIDGVNLYGVFSLVYSLIPFALFGASRFILIFFAQRIMNFLLFFLAGLALFRTTQDKRVFSYWFLNPYLISELLMNAHNDLLMVAGFIFSMFFLYKSQKVKSLVVFLISISTKSPFLSPVLFGLPLFFLKREKRESYFKLISLGMFLLFNSPFLPHTVMSWYYTWFYMFLPFAKLKNISWVLVFLIGLVQVLGYQSLLYPWADFISKINSHYKETALILGLGIVLVETNLISSRIIPQKIKL